LTFHGSCQHAELLACLREAAPAKAGVSANMSGRPTGHDQLQLFLARPLPKLARYPAL